MIKGRMVMKSPLELFHLEKRKHPRFSVDLPLEYWKTYNPLSQSSRLINISQGGVLIYLPEPVEIGQNLKLKILTDARFDSDPIEALAQVICNVAICPMRMAIESGQSFWESQQRIWRN